MVLIFCPDCNNLLLVHLATKEDSINGSMSEGRQYLKCHACLYKYEISKPTIFERKQVDDVLGGADAWKNVDSTDATCPKCEHNRAYFMQIQIRSADEPSSIFYKCCRSDCGHQWREN